MELHKHTELISLLMREATRKINILEKALRAQGLSRHDGTPSLQHNFAVRAEHVLEQEQDWWESAYHGLTLARTALEQVERSERRRGVSL